MVDAFLSLRAMGCIFVILLVLRTLPPSVDAVDAYHASLPSSYRQSLSSSQPLSNGGFGNYAIDSVTAQVMNEIKNNQASARSAFASSSPECWMASINAINQLSIGTGQNDGGDYQKRLPTSSGSFFCASMTVAQQDILALELTNCQLTRANLPFYDTNVVRERQDQTEVQGCLVGTGGLSPYDASSCFRLMSPYSFNLYNTFLFHTKEVCVSLTEERTMMQKEEVTLQLLRASSAVSHQMEEAARAIEHKVSQTVAMMQEHTEKIIREQREELQRSNIARRQGEQDSIRAAASTIEQMANTAASIMQEHTEKIMMDQREGLRLEQESIRAAALDIEQMANQTASILQGQTENIMSKHEALEAALQKREREATMAVERLKTETASLITEQALHSASMMKEQTEKIMTEQREELRRMNAARKQEEQDRAAAEARLREESIRAAELRLHEMIVSANSQLQPLSSIETYVRMAVGGFSAIKALLNFFFSTNVTWVVTAVPILLRGRRYAYAIFSLGLVAECVVIWFADSAPSLERDGIDAIVTVRFFTRASAVVAVILSSFVACFVPSRRAASSFKMDDEVRSQMEFVTQLNRSVPTEVAKRVRSPHEAAKFYTPTSIKFGQDMERLISTGTDENASFIISNRNFNPNRRRSKSSRIPSLTGVAAPVVTPTKPRAETIESISRASICDRDSLIKLSHRHYANTKQDAPMKQDEEANCLQFDRVTMLIQNGGDEMSASSSDESYFVRSTSSAKTSNKRKASDLYSSSDDESNFFSANDDDFSVSSARDCALQLKRAEGKKTKLIKSSIY